jgi:hypothetical protein
MILRHEPEGRLNFELKSGQDFDVSSANAVRLPQFDMVTSAQS